MLTLSAIDANMKNENFTVFDDDVVVVSVIIIGVYFATAKFSSEIV